MQSRFTTHTVWDIHRYLPHVYKYLPHFLHRPCVCINCHIGSLYRLINNVAVYTESLIYAWWLWWPCDSCTANCIWSAIQSQSPISISLVSFRRNVAKESQMIDWNLRQEKRHSKFNRLCMRDRVTRFNNVCHTWHECHVMDSRVARRIQMRDVTWLICLREMTFCFSYTHAQAWKRLQTHS